MGTVTLKVDFLSPSSRQTSTFCFELSDSLFQGHSITDFIREGYVPEGAEIMKVTDSVEETLFTTVLTDKK